jgi:hypothetical protein
VQDFLGHPKPFGLVREGGGEVYALVVHVLLRTPQHSLSLVVVRKLRCDVLDHPRHLVLCEDHPQDAEPRHVVLVLGPDVEIIKRFVGMEFPQQRDEAVQRGREHLLEGLGLREFRPAAPQHFERLLVTVLCHQMLRWTSEGLKVPLCIPPGVCPAGRGRRSERGLGGWRFTADTRGTQSTLGHTTDVGRLDQGSRHRSLDAGPVTSPRGRSGL